MSRDTAAARTSARDDVDELVRHKRERFRLPRPRAPRSATKTPPPRRVYVCPACERVIGDHDSWANLGAGSRRHVVCP